MISVFVNGGDLDVAVPVEVRKRLKAVAQETNWGGDRFILGTEAQVRALDAVVRATAKEKGETLYPSDHAGRGRIASKVCRACLCWLANNDCLPRWSLEASDLGQPFTQKIVSGQSDIELAVELYPADSGGVSMVSIVPWSGRTWSIELLEKMGVDNGTNGA